MNPDRQQAIDYLRAPAPGLWRWAEDGAVVVWRDDTTVAFREEIISILEWLAPNGLPPFGAIVLLLAAARGKVPTIEDLVPSPETRSADPGPPPELLLAARRQLRLQVGMALAELEKVSRLPHELNAGLKPRCVLAEAVFETALAERHVSPLAILKGMQEPLSALELLDFTRPTGRYIREIHLVSEGLKRHTAESLALRLRTGLDALPGATETDLPTAERARRLIQDLSRDPDIGVMARAAHELMAAVRLPRRLGERDELAIGGVADITNRGPLDRLLLSELAHDDLTLSVRVALNEALYLRREPPGREPPGTLALLLDSGVRQWGIPRVLATSVALALVACDKQHREVRAWRAQGKELRDVNVLTRTGLTQHLAALEIEAHPGAALPAFAREVAADARQQSVIITHRDALEDPEFRRALSSTPGVPQFVATVDRDGRFALHALPLAHRQPLCEAVLDLKTILDDPKGVPLRRPDIDPGWPAILGLPQFPFLLPVAGIPDFWVEGGDGFTYALLQGRQLVKFRDFPSGARVLATDLPPGKTVWMDWVDGEVHLVKTGTRNRPARLVTVPAQAHDARVTDLARGLITLAVHRYGEVILLIHHGEVCAYALGDGRLLARKENPHLWFNSRYFRGKAGIYFVAWDGADVQFERVTGHAPGIAFVFDRKGFEGPWFVHHDGRVQPSGPGPAGTLPVLSSSREQGYCSVSVSRDGHRLAWTSTANLSRIMDLRNDQVWTAGSSQGACPPLEEPPPLPSWNLYRTIESIAVLRDGLAFRGRKGRWRRLTLSRSHSLRISELPAHENPRGEPLSFPTKVQPARHCSLRCGEWPNGTKVFLDDRGLLHFKSGDLAWPEVSLVLAEQEVAGWTSDGFVCGPRFFFEGPHTSEPERVFERLLRILHPCLKL